MAQKAPHNPLPITSLPSSSITSSFAMPQPSVSGILHLPFSLPECPCPQCLQSLLSYFLEVSAPMSPSQTSSDPLFNTANFYPQHLLHFKILFSIELIITWHTSQVFYLFDYCLPPIRMRDLLLVLKQYLVHSGCLVNIC